MSAKGLIDPSETVVVELSDGTVLFNMRNETGTNRRAVAFSPNGYEGWTVPVFDETLIEPVCNAGMTATEGMLFFVNPAHTRFRRRATVRIRAGRKNFNPFLFGVFRYCRDNRREYSYSARN